MSLPDTFQLPQCLSRGDLVRVGMRVNRSQIVYLIIEKSGTDLRKEYELGDIIAKFFVDGLMISN